MNMADTLEIRKEEVVLRFMGRINEGKRWLYNFENPNDKEHPLKYSAFDPDTPKLEEGTTYKMTVEHVPFKDGSGKAYHNLARSRKDGPYLIEKAGGDFAPASQIKTPQVGAQASTQANRDEYWARKEAKDALREPSIIRQSCMKAAAQIVVGELYRGDKIVDTVDRAIEIAERLKKWVDNGKNGKVPDPEKKEGPEAFVA